MARKLAPVKCCYCELSIDRNTEPYGRPLKALGSTELNPRRYATNTVASNIIGCQLLNLIV